MKGCKLMHVVGDDQAGRVPISRKSVPQRERNVTATSRKWVSHQPDGGGGCRKRGRKPPDLHRRPSSGQSIEPRAQIETDLGLAGTIWPGRSKFRPGFGGGGCDRRLRGGGLAAPAVPIEREGVHEERISEELGLLAELALRVGPTQVQ